MIRTALQSAIVGIVASALALWARFGMRWWPASPLEKAAYFTACPACPVDVVGKPPLNAAMLWVLLGGVVYAGIGVGIEAARRMRRGDIGESGNRGIG